MVSRDTMKVISGRNIRQVWSSLLLFSLYSVTFRSPLPNFPHMGNVVNADRNQFTLLRKVRLLVGRFSRNLQSTSELLYADLTSCSQIVYKIVEYLKRPFCRSYVSGLADCHKPRFTGQIFVRRKVSKLTNRD